MKGRKCMKRPMPSRSSSLGTALGPGERPGIPRSRPGTSTATPECGGGRAESHQDSWPLRLAAVEAGKWGCGRPGRRFHCDAYELVHQDGVGAVSYTHLTLP